MNVDQLLNYLTIFIIGSFCIYLYDFVGTAKHNLIKSIIRAVVFKDLEYLKWHWKTKVYLLCNSLLILLISLNLTLITLFSNNNIFNKPLITFIISPLIWAVIFAFAYTFLQPYKEHHSS